MESICRLLPRSLAATKCEEEQESFFTTSANWKKFLPMIREDMRKFVCSNGSVGLENDPENFAEIAAKVVARETARGKGVLLMGTVGSGKTDRVKFLATVNGDIPVLTAESICGYWMECGGKDTKLHSFLNCDIPRWSEKRTDCCDLVIDDLGTENERTVLFGNVFDLFVEKVIPWRYSLFPQFKTHFTTNLDETALAKRYGERAFSRLNEMCAFIPLKHNDRRREARHA